MRAVVSRMAGIPPPRHLVIHAFDAYLRGPQGHIALRELSQAPPRVAPEALRS